VSTTHPWLDINDGSLSVDKIMTFIHVFLHLCWFRADNDSYRKLICVFEKKNNKKHLNNEE